MFVHTVFCFKRGTFDCIVFIDNVDFWAQSPHDRMKVVSVFTGYKKIELYFCANIYLNYGGNSLTFTMILVLTVDTWYSTEEKKIYCVFYGNTEKKVIFKIHRFEKLENQTKIAFLDSLYGYFDIFKTDIASSCAYCAVWQKIEEIDTKIDFSQLCFVRTKLFLYF